MTADLIKRSYGGRTPAFALFALGWLASGYLLYRSLTLGAGARGGDVCTAVFGSGCDETLLSPSSLQFGLPLAGWGLVYFAVVGLLLAIGTRPTDRAVLLLTAGGVGASLVMTWWLFSGRTPLCPLCLLVHAANIALLVVLARLPEADRERVPRNRGWAAAVGLAVIVGVTVQVIASQPGRHGGAKVDRERIVEAYESIEPVELPTAAEATEARVRLAVFSSFQCPACRHFAVAARHLEEHFGEDLAIDYKHFPLESECNQAVVQDLQPRSCEAALAAEAARLQQAFWTYHDGLFDSDLSASEDLLAAIASRSGLDIERWSTDRASFAVASRVRADAALGEQLGIQGTPTVFLNGRRLGNPSLPELETLIAHLLGTAPVH